MHRWKVVPISDNQMLDVNPDDLILDRDFRLCQTYKGGGGYDKFPYIATSRGLVKHPNDANLQFVVQLFGCNLDCPYCYVTREGVWGDFVYYTTEEMVNAWKQAQETHGANVFHLMGGAPALQLPNWPELLDMLGSDVIFHSDLMLSERVYKEEQIRALDRENVLLAVNIKGTDKESWETNTRKPYNLSLIECNIEALKDWLSPERWYLTFTNISSESRDEYLERYGLTSQTNYIIDLIEYEAMPLVDSVEWGRKK